MAPVPCERQAGVAQTAWHGRPPTAMIFGSSESSPLLNVVRLFPAERTGRVDDLMPPLQSSCTSGTLRLQASDPLRCQRVNYPIPRFECHSANWCPVTMP